MFDFVFFFLVFLPAMDVIRQLTGLSWIKKFTLTVAITGLCGTYFVYTSILAEKPKNYYELLDIPARGVQQSELKKAFRRASIKYHPDKNPNKDTTELFLEVKNAQDIISDEKMRYAYDVYQQTSFDQEEQILKGLKYSKKSEEEQEHLYWHIINNKRMFSSLLEILPYYCAWIMAIILLVNRSYGRTFLAVTCAAIGVFEFVSKIYYGDPKFDPVITLALNFLPSNYTLGEGLKVLRYGMPLFLQCALLMMDNSFDLVTAQEDDPTAILQKICLRQRDLIERAKAVLEKRKSLADGEDTKVCQPMVAELLDEVISFNATELCAGISEALDVDEKKKNDQNLCVRIFKSLISFSMIAGIASYILLGPESMRGLKVQTMQGASTKS